MQSYTLKKILSITIFCLFAGVFAQDKNVVIESKDDFQKRLKANVIIGENGDVSISPLPPPPSGVNPNETPMYDWSPYLIYIDPNFDFAELEEIWEKEKKSKGDAFELQMDSIKKYFAKRKLKLLKDVPIKETQINNFLESGIPIISAARITEEFVAILTKRNEIRKEQLGTKKWREYLNNEERNTIKGIINKKSLSIVTNVFIIGVNKNTDEYLMQLRHLQNKPSFWLTLREFKAMDCKGIRVITP